MRIIQVIVLLWFACLLSVVPSVFAQEQHLSAYRLQHFTDQNGLPQNSVKAIMADKNGFVWLSTEAGLVRFDGHKFILFEKSALPISSNRIRGFVPNVLAHTGHGKYEFYALTEGNEYAGILKNGLASVDTTFYGGYQKINPYLANQIRHNSMLASLPSQYAVDPFVDDYFAATEKQLFYIWQSNKITCYKQGKPSFSVDGPFKHFLLIGTSPFAIDMKGKFVKISPQSQHRALSLSGDITANELYSPDQNTYQLYWNNVSRQAFLYLNKCFYIIKESESGTLTTTLILKDFDFNNLSIVTAFYDEAQSFLFLGSITKGLYLIKKNDFQTLKMQVADADNVYYAQKPGPGRSVLTAQGYRMGLSPNGSKALASRASAFMEDFSHKFFMAANRDSTFWFGAGKVLFKLDQSGEKILARLKVPENFTSLFVDQGNKLWIGCDHDNLYRLDDTSGGYKFTSVLRGRFGRINMIGQETPGTLLLGTEAGLHRFHFSSGKHEVVSHFKNMNIRSFHATAEGTWITTYGNGIYLLRGNKLVRFPLDKDRFLATAHCIVEDKNGFFWITTNRGLFQVAKAQLLDYAKSNGNLVYYLYYDQTYGFSTNEFNGGCNPCAVKLADGTISLPTMDGLVWFSPLKIKSELPGKAIFISSINVDGKDIAVGDTLEVPRDFQQMRMQASTPYMGHVNNIQMEYSLSGEGRPEKWLPINQDFVIPVSKMAYGEYRLIIRKINGFQHNDYSYKTIALHIPPAWFETWWFKSLLAILLLALFFFAVKWRTGYLVKKDRGKNLLRHYRVISQIIAAVNHDIQTPLYYIGYSLRQINSYLHQQPSGNSLITRMSDESLNTTLRLSTLTKNLLDYVKLQNNNAASRTQMGEVKASELVSSVCEVFSAIAAFRQIGISNQVPADFIVWSDPNLLAIVIHNLLDNALKISKSEVIISAGSENEKKQIVIEDTGEGMPDDLIKWLNKPYRSYEEWLRVSTHTQQKGIGLVIVKDLCVLLQINIIVTAKQGSQTIIQLIF
ncbi:sensor histidine kinase [Dyadobacter pollutisoli]|uniref:histidine kinase n=1 Tax=Dyadobacter pollutisoli TaxID=2910158 RepID=A0A9E8NGB4_9BACT|nr:two-component regulator propeller domain-containing protein [Dyadobacter pollutisoli]WAC13554.1 ATP-binding protein [Dyadobacter pollutisoli]